MVEVLALITTAINLAIAVMNLTAVMISNRNRKKDFHSAGDRRKPCD